MLKRLFSLIFVLAAAALIVSAAAASESSVELGLNETRTIDAPANVMRAVSADQDTALVEVLSSSAFKITGVGLGTTYVYVWWTDGSYSVFKVSVKTL